jgi:hypothetical protein
MSSHALVIIRLTEELWNRYCEEWAQVTQCLDEMTRLHPAVQRLAMNVVQFSVGTDTHAFVRLVAALDRIAVFPYAVVYQAHLPTRFDSEPRT